MAQHIAIPAGHKLLHAEPWTVPCGWVKGSSVCRPKDSAQWVPDEDGHGFTSSEWHRTGMLGQSGGIGISRRGHSASTPECHVAPECLCHECKASGRKMKCHYGSIARTSIKHPSLPLSSLPSPTATLLTCIWWLCPTTAAAPLQGHSTRMVRAAGLGGRAPSR